MTVIFAAYTHFTMGIVLLFFLYFPYISSKFCAVSIPCLHIRIYRIIISRFQCSFCGVNIHIFLTLHRPNYDLQTGPFTRPLSLTGEFATFWKLLDSQLHSQTLILPSDTYSYFA